MDKKGAEKDAKKYLENVLKQHKLNEDLVPAPFIEGSETLMLSYNDLYKDAGINQCFEMVPDERPKPEEAETATTGELMALPAPEESESETEN